MLDGVGDRLAHRQLDLVAGAVGEAEVERHALGELARLLEQPQVRAQKVLLWLKTGHRQMVVPRHH